MQDIEPERDSNGKGVEYAPQSQYQNQNTKGKRLHNYGSGTFCRFRIDAGLWPGVYLWVLDDEKGGGGSSEKLKGSCLASFLLILIVPMVGVPFIGYLMM